MQKKSQVPVGVRFLCCLVLFTTKFVFGQEGIQGPGFDETELCGYQNRKPSFGGVSSSGVTKSPENSPNICLLRKVINVSLGAVTVAGIAGWIAMDIRKDRLRTESEETHSVLGVIEKEIEWQRARARRNLFGTIALGSGTTLAISLVIPIGSHNRSGLFERKPDRRRRKNHSGREDS